jgi:hypothetical protein
MLDNLPDYVLAAGALGTSAMAVVDASKSVFGGVSNAGFGQIRRAILRLFPDGANQADRANPLALGGVIATLRANWLNGTALSDQQAIARTLIKLRLDPANTDTLAAATGVDAAALRGIARKIATGEALTPAETDVFGRFDLILTTLLDEGYQRADQIYRNSAKAMSVVASVVLGFLGGWAIKGGDLAPYLSSPDVGAALMTGLIATPLAPISKDVASGITSAIQAIGLIRK